MLDCCPVFNVIAVIFDVFGILSNVMILFFLHLNEVGSRLTTLLMKNQFVFDGMASACAFISLVWRDETFTNTSVFSKPICYIWTSRSLFWLFVLLSETNLMCLAVDRLRAIVFSLSYKQYERHTLIFFYVFTFVFSILNSVPSVFLVEFRNHTCIHIVEHSHTESFHNYLLFAAYLWCINGYLLHAITMGICHLKVIKTIHQVWRFKKKTTSQSSAFNYVSQASHTSDLQHSNQSSRFKVVHEGHNKAGFSRSITIPAIVMWTVFLITHAYQAVFFILYAHNLVDFRSTSVERRIATLSTIINSALNPLIMVLSSPPFRRSIGDYLKTWFTCCRPPAAHVQH